MPANSFSVTISAKDSASGTIDAINKRMAGFNAEIARTRAPFEKLADNYAKFTKLTGADRIAKGLADVGRAGFSAFQSVSRIVEPLAAIVGAASIAGMYRLATAWANFGTNLGNVASRAGLTASQMHVLQNAGRLAGVSAEALSGGMTALRDNMVNAQAGKAPQVIGMLQALGLSADDARRYAADTTKALPELADKIAALRDPTLQAEAATTLFGGAGEQLLPFLKKGSAGIAEYTERAKRYGVVNEEGVAAANRLREAQAELQLAVEGLGNSIAQQLAPIIGPLLTQMADWIAKNREWIAQGIGEKVGQFADFLKSVDWARIGSGIASIADGATSVATALGGWVPVGMAILGFFTVTWLAKMMVPLLTIGRMLTKLPGEAAAAATKAEAELSKVGGGPRSPAGRSLGLGLGLLGIASDLSEGKTEADQHAVNTESPLAKLGMGLGGALGMNFDANGHSEGLLSRWFGGGSRAAAAAPAAGPGPRAIPGEGGPLRAPVTAVPGASGDGRRANAAQWAQDMAQLQAHGWSRQQAAGILGNLDQESGGDHTAKGDGGHAFGLAQWHEDRQANFAKQFGHDIQHSTHAEQIDFVNWELHNTERGAGDKLAAAQTERQAAAAVRKYYERPADASGQEDNWRGARAERIAAQTAQLAPSGPERALPANAGTAAAPGGLSPGDISGKIDTTIRFANEPPGTQVSTVQSGAAMAPLRVERSRVGAI